MSHNDNDKIRDSSTVSNPPLSNVLFEALGRIIFDCEKIVFGAFNIGCPLSLQFPLQHNLVLRNVIENIASVTAVSMATSMIWLIAITPAYCPLVRV